MVGLRYTGYGQAFAQFYGGQERTGLIFCHRVLILQIADPFAAGQLPGDAVMSRDCFRYLPGCQLALAGPQDQGEQICIAQHLRTVLS